MNMSIEQDLIHGISKFSSCDISDALGKLLSPEKCACHIPDLQLFSPKEASRNEEFKLIGVAYTVEFALSSDPRPSKKPAHHHVDSAPDGCVMVIKSPAKAPNAVWGGLMTAGAMNRGVKGVVVEGKVRDIHELWGSNFPVFAKGLSTLGAAPYSRLHAVNEPITLGEDCAYPVLVNPGDLIVADQNGVVRVPHHMIQQVTEKCQELVTTDTKCMEDIKRGRSIAEAFAEHRGSKPANK